MEKNLADTNTLSRHGEPLRIGIIGMGGFAGSHHDAILQLQASDQCRLVCACDPNLRTFVEKVRAWQFDDRGVRVFDDYRHMLTQCAGELDVVSIPTPVPLHAEMHRACIERGLAVYLEKPPTLDIHELDQMIELEAGARKQTNVGFNFIVESARQSLKQRLLQGEFGRLNRLCLSGLWPRSRAYFQRATWAGRLMLDDRLVLDSCMGNALAHYVHNMLYWAGQDTQHSWGSPREVQAELYRAHTIEGTDTIFLKAELMDSPSLWIALTHACAGDQYHEERIECDDAVITYVTAHDYSIAWRDGRSETGAILAATLAQNLSAYFAYVRGEADRPLTSLQDSRAFVLLNDLAYIAAGHISTVPMQHLTITPEAAGGSEYVAINGIQEAFDGFFRRGLFPSEMHMPWAQAGGSARMDNLPQLSEIVRRMCQNHSTGSR